MVVQTDAASPSGATSAVLLIRSPARAGLVKAAQPVPPPGAPDLANEEKAPIITVARRSSAGESVAFRSA